MSNNATTQTLADLWHKGYRPKNFTALNRPSKSLDPVGVLLLARRDEFYESVVFERFGQWIYATPEKLVRDEGKT